jgi:hypothetical protein
LWPYRGEDYMKFKATIDQIRVTAALAVNASRPFGMGMLHFQPKEYKPEEIDLNFDQFGFTAGKKEGSVSLDYYEGRMVKLNITGLGNDTWECRSGKADPEYQSWARKYPTYEALLSAAGIVV